MPASFSSASYSPDKLIAGDQIGLTHRTVTVLSGQNVVRGAVLGKITSGGKYILSLSAASDGSQTPDVILAEDCDASAGDATALVYETGVFNTNALTIGASHTAATIREGLRAKGIHLVTGVSA
jgi:hypothetical protein